MIVHYDTSFYNVVLISFVFIFSLLEALQTGSAFSRDQKRRRGPRVAGGKFKQFFIINKFKKSTFDLLDLHKDLEVSSFRRFCVA